MTRPPRFVWLGTMLLLGFVTSVLSAQEPPTPEPLAPTPLTPVKLERIRVSDDGKSFVTAESKRPFLIWGANYDHDDAGRLIEDYWLGEWDTVVVDFREMKALRINTVRIHLQLGRFMATAETTNPDNLAQLKKLIVVAEQTGLYLDLTGLGCYHKQDTPAWYDALDEAARWEVQARFWQAIAKTCDHSHAVLCYDLMNEPILPNEPTEPEWLGGEFDGKYFVQRISRSLDGRTREAVAAAWVKQLTTAIRAVDDDTMITVGVIPWAFVFKGAKPLFYAPEVCGPLDFVSIHVYPKKGDVAGALEAMKVYELGKPLVIEEIFPMNASVDETHAFIDGSKPIADGWVSFYWGKTIDDYAAREDVTAKLIGGWLGRFREHAPTDGK